MAGMVLNLTSVGFEFVLERFLVYGLMLPSRKSDEASFRTCVMCVLGRGDYFSTFSEYEPAQATLLLAIELQTSSLASAFGRTSFPPYCSPKTVIYPKAKVLADAERGGVDGHADAEVGDLAGPPNWQVVLKVVGR